MFVHDFVTVPVPVLPALNGLTAALQTRAAELVHEAWLADADTWTALGLPAEAVTPRSPFVMSLDAPRLREDAAVIHMAWHTQGARLIPSVDADLELAARGPTRSDLQLLGTYRYDEHAPASAAERSLSHRATVSAVRHLLEALAAAATGDAHIGSTPFRDA